METISDRIKAKLADLKRLVTAPENPEAVKVRREIAERDAYYAAKERIERLGAIGIPAEHWPHLDAPASRKAIAEVVAFMLQPSTEPKASILVLGGKGGEGKSFAGSYALYANGGLFVPAIDLVRTSNFDDEYWGRLANVRLLVIDDLGTEKRDAKGELDQRLFALFNARLASKTIVTTNLSGPEFMSRYAEGTLQRLHRRFMEHGRFVPITEAG